MLSATFEIINYLRNRWNRSIYSSIEDQLDQSIQNLCISLCIISVIPFTLCYDIGNCYIPLWEREEIEEIEVTEETPKEVPIVLPRRSARLAEKRAKQKLL